MLFKWDDKYSVNVHDIDCQHKRLFDIGAKIYELISLNDEYDHYDEIMEVLGELKDYTVYHFGYEEKLLDKYGFKDIDTHKIEHRFFVKKLEKINAEDFEGKKEDSLLDLISFIADWITGHILKSDMAYKDFLNKNGIL